MPGILRKPKTITQRKTASRLAKKNLPRNPKLRKKVTAQRGAKRISQIRRPLRGKRVVRKAR